MTDRYNLDVMTVGEVCKDLSDRVSGTVIVVPNPDPIPDPLPPDAQPLLIGSNLVPANLALFGDLNRLSSWQNAGNGYSFGPPPTAAPADSYYFHNLPPPEADGEFHTYSWREPGNTTAVSTWARRFTSADSSNTRMTDVTVSHSGGLFTARFRYFGDFGNRDPRGRIEWRGAGTIVPVDFREETLPAATRIRPLIVSVSSQLPGTMRFLELCQFNDWAQDWAWSERQRVSPPPGHVTKQPGMAIEDCIAICNATNRAPGWVFTHKLSEATVKATMRAFFYGEGTDGGGKLNPSLVFPVELCDNEPWHSPFVGAYGDLANIGFATGYDGTDPNYSRLYAQAKRSQQVATWIEEAVPDQMHRVIRIASLSPETDMNDYLSLLDYGLTKFEAVTQSVYMGIGIKNARYGGNTPAELQQPFSEDAALQTSFFLRNRPRYIADGKRHIAYEIGIDVAGNAWTPEEKDAFLIHPGTKATYLREWRRIAAENGDRCDVYWDFGYYRQAGFGSWGHYQGHGLPSPKWDVVLQVQSEVDAAAG